MVSTVITLGIVLAGCNTVGNSNVQNQNAALKRQLNTNNNVHIYNSGSAPKSYKVVGKVYSAGFTIHIFKNYFSFQHLLYWLTY